MFNFRTNFASDLNYIRFELLKNQSQILLIVVFFLLINQMTNISDIPNPNVGRWSESNFVFTNKRLMQILFVFNFFYYNFVF